MELDFERCYRVVSSRDPRFDGWFVTAVTSTGIYCRPSCPAITPKRVNVRFLATAATAQRAGFRACLRCRPDAAPGSPEWDIRADLTARAMRLIADGIVDREGVPGLAHRLGYTQRHLYRMLTTELGAGPLALARAQRAQTARILTETTDLGLAEIAFAAGFGSVRQFNDTIREIYGRAPSELRRAAAARAEPAMGTGSVTLRLPYREPLHAPALFDYLAARCVPGVERVDADGYHRVLRLPSGPAQVSLRAGTGYVLATVRLADLRDLSPAVARCRRLLDLDADPVAVDDVLAADPVLAPLVAKEPGVRLPRAADGFELAVRAVVGQQISVSSARTVLARLVQSTTGEPANGERPVGGPGTGDRTTGDRTNGGRTNGGPAADERPSGGAATAREQPSGEQSAQLERVPLTGFPTAAELLALPDQAFRMPTSRRATLQALARAVVDGGLDLDGGAERGAVLDRLAALPGIGAWTTGYLAARALGDPDVLLTTDLGIRRAAGSVDLPTRPAELADHALAWRPWRSYAMARLWRLG